MLFCWLFFFSDVSLENIIFMFSLMKKPMGFMPRYSYLGSFILIFFQAVISPTGKNGVWYSAAYYLFAVPCIPDTDWTFAAGIIPEFLLFNIAFLVIVPCILYEIDRSYRINVKKNFMMGLLACMLIWEMSMSACIFLSMRSGESLYLSILWWSAKNTDSGNQSIWWRNLPYQSGNE